MYCMLTPDKKASEKSEPKKKPAEGKRTRSKSEPGKKRKRGKKGESSEEEEDIDALFVDDKDDSSIEDVTPEDGEVKIPMTSPKTKTPKSSPVKGAVVMSDSDKEDGEITIGDDADAGTVDEVNPITNIF